MDVPDSQEENQSDETTQLIKPIDKSTVHRICSGQVVLSLAVAVKELIENSIDAGATIINILLKEYGSELIEVSDNGCGVLEQNCAALTLKHYTSKIRQFSDLESIGTLGFRGEALSSLCALSDLCVITKHHTAEIATKILYDHNGKILNKTSAARETGTTVTLENLFSTLPVRRKEFMKNLKREFNRMCQLLYAYCLVSKGIKFTCTNLTKKGTKSTVVATDGKTTVRENIINVFGAKQISQLVDVDLIVPDEPISSEYGITVVPGEKPFTFEFLISSVTHGNGRSTTDRQFYFINSRPCDPSKLSKLVNEVYRQFNSSQYPFVYFNLVTKSSLVDVNVTPDKRQIFLENEKILLATVKASLLEIFQTFPSMFKSQNLDVSQMLKEASNSDRGIKRSFTEGSVKKGSILETFKKRSKTDPEAAKTTKTLFDFQISRPKTKLISSDSDENNCEVDPESQKNLNELIKIACKLSNETNDENITDFKERENKTKHDNTMQIIKLDGSEDGESQLKVNVDCPTTIRPCKKMEIFDVNMQEIREVLRDRELCDANKDIKIKFRSGITPENNKSAEEELNKQINKTDFAKMEILGQFNLGFIITRLNNDLFIIDQHATDEKYNFEQLQMNTVIESQILVHPKPLELTAGNETLLIENIEVFKKNGFSFNIDPEAPCTKKVALTSIPISKQFVFGKDDIDELLFMLQDSNHTMCRPSRVRAMFASRACRKSVMIGKHLSKSTMKKLVDHMGEIDQPWNCPHGRPTMRHLINLDQLDETPG